MRQYAAYAKLITSTNRRRSDGTPLDGRHGVFGRCSGSSWRCIMKCDTLSWFDLYYQIRLFKKLSQKPLAVHKQLSPMQK